MNKYSADSFVCKSAMYFYTRTRPKPSFVGTGLFEAVQILRQTLLPIYVKAIDGQADDNCRGRGAVQRG